MKEEEVEVKEEHLEEHQTASKPMKKVNRNKGFRKKEDVEE